MLIDTHIHLNFESYESDRDELLRRAKDAGVDYSIAIGAGDGISSMDGALRIAAQYDQVFATVGVHPQDASKDISEADLISRFTSKKIVAIGETGLDFFRDSARPDDQRRWFRIQIELAKEKKLPLVIHSRDAGEECLATLKELRADEVGGVFHCYSEDEHFAKRLRDINFLISITGTVTFKKADKLREIVAAIPLDQIMLETDGPYMSPEPFRGKRSESAHVRLIADKIAEIKNCTIEEVGRVTTENARRLFKLPIE